MKSPLVGRVKANATTNLLIMVGILAFGLFLIGAGVYSCIDGGINICGIVGGVAGLIIAGIGALLVVQPARDAFAPTKAPVFRRLERHGDVREVVRQIDAEILGDKEEYGPFMFTASWLIIAADELQVLAYSEVSGVSQRSEAKRAKGVEVGRTHYLTLTHGESSFEVSVPDAHASNVLLCLRQRLGPGVAWEMEPEAFLDPTMT